jgi:hypothetical protein
MKKVRGTPWEHASAATRERIAASSPLKLARWVTGMGPESEVPGSDNVTGTGGAARRCRHERNRGGALGNDDEQADDGRPPKAR